MIGISYRVVAPAAVACLLAAGCGAPPAAGLQGAVTVAGRPVETGTIRLFPVEGTPGPGAASRVSAGRFAIESDKGLVPGRYLVAIAATRPTGRTLATEPGYESGGPVAEQEQYIPERYNARSELRVTLAAGDNEHDFSLPPL